MKAFYSVKLKQNGSGLLWIHFVHEIEAVLSSWFFMLIVSILKWSTSIERYLLMSLSFKFVFDSEVKKRAFKCHKSVQRSAAFFSAGGLWTPKDITLCDHEIVLCLRIWQKEERIC